MNVFRHKSLILILISLTLSACNASSDKREQAPKITVATVQSKAVTLTHQYVCQIQSHQHINIRAAEIGYLDAVNVKEGQAVKEGDLLFKVNYKKLFEDDVVTENRALPFDKQLERARAEAHVAALALGGASINAPFDGIVGPLKQQVGSVVRKGEALTTLSDDSVLWVYFNVPEARYLEYKANNLDQHMDDVKVELFLANGTKFDQHGKLAAIGANFNHETGGIQFRADFPNPGRLLRHGKSGTISLSRVQNDAVVIPQQATFEVNQKRYVYVIDKNHVAHRREVEIANELDDLFVVKTGVGVGDKIVLEGIRQVKDGDKVG